MDQPRCAFEGRGCLARTKRLQQGWQGNCSAATQATDRSPYLGGRTEQHEWYEYAGIRPELLPIRHGVIEHKSHEYYVGHGETGSSPVFAVYLLSAVLIFAVLEFGTEQAAGQPAYCVAQLLSVVGLLALSVLTYRSIAAAPFREGAGAMFFFNPLLMVILGS